MTKNLPDVMFTYYKDNKRETKYQRKVGGMSKADAEWFCALFEHVKDFDELAFLCEQTYCADGAVVARAYKKKKVSPDWLHFYHTLHLTQDEINEVRSIAIRLIP